MCNFGFHRLRIVNAYDLSFREARSAVGASHVLANAEQFATLADAVADCTLVVGTMAIGHRQMQHPLKLLRDGASEIVAETSAPSSAQTRVAILFGSEKFGLSNRDLSHCHWLVHIPTHEEQPSMNLGQAVAVCLYEIARNTRVSVPSQQAPHASAEQAERVTALLLETLRASEYLPDRASSQPEEAVRRMVRRMTLSTDDASTWLGILRQILWKLRKQR